MFDFKLEIAHLPALPGVYIMRDSDNKIIYVGKAVNLKNRVKSYFQKNTGHTAKVLTMVSKVASFEYIVTDTELEALVLECNLIKLHKPQYNILLKDDKGYPFIRISVNEEYPTLSLARKVAKDGAKYFGPYFSSWVVNESIDVIENIFPLKTCAKKLPRDVQKTRPCLNYHLGRCVAPCQGGVNKEEYRNMMTDIIRFLNGHTEEIVKKLEDKMLEASQNLEFEKAAEFRDKIDLINEKTTAKQKITGIQAENTDVIGICQNEIDSCIQMFFIRGGKTIGRDFFILEGSGNDSPEDVVSGFLKQFYEETAFLPSTILLPVMIPDIELMEEWMQSHSEERRVYIKAPQRGEKKDLVNMASKNAEIQLRNFSIRLKGIRWNELKILEKFTDMFQMDKVPARIEAYDVSNTGTEENVASMVVFENGKPNKKEYKRFNIKDRNWKGDVESMREVLTRRFAHEEIRIPDIIMADGGILHENMVREVIAASEREEIKDIKVFGMVKDDRHRTRGLISEGREYDLKKDLEIFRFITSIQDEAHRFAISYNKKLRDKRYTKSSLDDISGIGKTRKLALLKKFGSASRVKKATKEELMEVDGISANIAQNIIDALNKPNTEG